MSGIFGKASKKKVHPQANAPDDDGLRGLASAPSSAAWPSSPSLPLLPQSSTAMSSSPDADFARFEQLPQASSPAASGPVGPQSDRGEVNAAVSQDQQASKKKQKQKKKRPQDAPGDGDGLRDLAAAPSSAASSLSPSPPQSSAQMSSSPAADVPRTEQLPGPARVMDDQSNESRKPQQQTMGKATSAQTGETGMNAVKALQILVEQALNDHEAMKAGTNPATTQSPSPQTAGAPKASNAGGTHKTGSRAKTKSTSKTGGAEEKEEAEEDRKKWKPPMWTMEEALSSELGKVVVKIFKTTLNLRDEQEGIVLQRIGSMEPGKLTHLLCEVLKHGGCTEQLSETFGQQLAKIANAEALTGEEMSEKFGMCPEESFTMVFGDKATYLKGLVPRIGLPSAKILPAIVQDHCCSKDSETPWTSGNYGIRTTSREDDFEAKPIDLEATYENTLPPRSTEQLLRCLGFKRWQGLWVEGGPDLEWADEYNQKSPALPRSAGRPLPHGCWLLELEGSKDLVGAAEALLRRWETSGDFRRRKLSARFAVAQPRQQKDLRECWLQRAGTAKQLEVGAARLERVWTIVPPRSFAKEWLAAGNLGDEGAKAWGKAFHVATAAGVFPPVPEECRLSESRVLEKSPDFWSALASTSHLKELDLSKCQLTSSFAESPGIGLSAFVTVGQAPFPNLRKLVLANNEGLGAGLREPSSFAKGLTALPALEELALCSCGLDSSFATALGSAMPEGCWPKLTKLRLSYNKCLGAWAPSAFAKGLTALPALEELDMKQCGLDSSFATPLGSAILEKEQEKEAAAGGGGGGGGGQGCWPQLKKLELGCNDRLGAELREPSAFAKGLAALPALKGLYLHECNLRDDFADALLSALSGSGFGSLEKLLLRPNHFSDGAKSRLRDRFKQERPKGFLII